MIDSVKEIWQTMCTNKLRTILTGISVSWGIFMLILLLAITNGLVTESMESAMKNDPNRISLWSGWTALPYKGYKEGRAVQLKDKYLKAIEQADPERISSAEGTMRYSSSTISTPRDRLADSNCEGVFPKTFNGRYKLVDGRFINDADLKHSRKVIVLHRSDVSTLFADTTKAIGSVVKVGSVAFTLVGSYDHRWDDTPYIPYTTAVALNGWDGNLQSVDVHIKNVSDETESGFVEMEVVRALSKEANFSPVDPSAVYTYDRFASFIDQQKAQNILMGAMWVIGLLTLVTGIVGVSNIMFVSVRERTHEIGIRRAIGAKPRNILTQIVTESVALTTLFGYIGVVMGTVATEAAAYYFKGNEFMGTPSVDFSIAIEVTVTLIIAGALAGIFPALRAIKIKPVEALRDE